MRDKDEQIKAAGHFRWSGFEEGLICKMLIQIEEIKELRIPFIILSTKGDMLLLTGEAKYKLVLEDSSVEDFLDAKFQNML